MREIDLTRDDGRRLHSYDARVTDQDVDGGRPRHTILEGDDRPSSVMKCGIDPSELARRYPFLFHMAADGSWESISRHGLLSTSALLDLFEVDDNARNRIETQHRPDYIPITHPLYGEAWIRDQKPMDDAGLRRALKDGLRPEDWYRLVNQRVFFWVTAERLERLIHGNHSSL